MLAKNGSGYVCNILDMDYEKIDDSLLGPNSWRKGKVSRRNDVAIPQGNPFIWITKPIHKLLGQGSLLYRR